MKLELNKKDFLKALQTGGMFAGSCKTLPILDCVKIKVSGDKINIVSTDNENAISKRITGVKSDEDGTFCVNMKDFSSYIKLIKADNFYITVENNIAEIKHENGSFLLPVYGDDDFPTMKPDNDSVEFSMDAALLNNWIADGRSFVANDELRPAMNGLYLYSENGEIGCCASDGHALFTDKVTIEGLPEFRFILNKSAFKPVCDAISDVENLVIKVGQRNVMFVAGGTSVIARQIDGRYVNFKAVLPKYNNISVKVNRKDMLDAIARCSIGANQSTMLTKINVGGIGMEISCEDIDFNRKAKEYLAVESNGNITIGFKSSLIIDILNHITTENAVINMKESSVAAVFTEDSENEKIYLLMPMLITD